MHAQRVSCLSKADKYRPHDRGNGGIRTSHHMARAGEDGKYRKWNDARIEAEHRRQPGHLRIADIEGDDQGRQGDAGRDLAGEICPRESPKAGKHRGPLNLVRCTHEVILPCTHYFMLGIPTQCLKQDFLSVLNFADPVHHQIVTY